MLRLTTPLEPSVASPLNGSSQAHDPDRETADLKAPIPGDPYRSVIFVLLAASLIGANAAYYGGTYLGNPALFAVSLTLALAGGVLAGVAAAQLLRARGPQTPGSQTPGTQTNAEPPAPEIAQEQVPPLNPVLARLQQVRGNVASGWIRVRKWLDQIGVPRLIGMATALAGGGRIGYLLLHNYYPAGLRPTTAGIGAGSCLVAAGLAATAARYLGAVEPELLPESAPLRRGARVTGWMLVLATLSIVLEWGSQNTLLSALYYLILAVNGAFCIGLAIVEPPHGETRQVFALDVGVLSVLGSRTNILASILDSAEQQLGIDIRSTWALTVVRRSVEPLVIGLLVIGWLSTCLTVVGPEEQGLIERMGVPVGGEALMPGLHLHLPWPTDRVYRVPAQRVQLIEIGHEGEEPGGPENVLWAVQHAPNEYTLLLGNGRDLITVDAAIQFRIRDVRAWRYNSQNPADALRALGYRAVMRDTVGRTLSEALSENVAALTSHMRAVVQRDADALGLGVDVLGFTVGGMHPPVAVARDYQAVVSAELRKVTTVVNAQAFRNQALPGAETAALTGSNTARAEGAATLAKAAGEAWAFRTVESQYPAAPAEYNFRRRLEKQEQGLGGRHFVIVDSRFERDGGLVWVIP